MPERDSPPEIGAEPAIPELKSHESERRHKLHKVPKRITVMVLHVDDGICCVEPCICHEHNKCDQCCEENDTSVLT